jgi:hypothetical protein
MNFDYPRALPSNFMVDASHHGPAAGSREWLKGNVARFYLRDLMLVEISMGYKPPNLVLRGHVHEYLREVLVHLAGDKEYESQLMLLPSYCGVSDYARKATKSEFILRNGLVVFELVDGIIYRVYLFTKVQDVRTYERIA